MTREVRRLAQLRAILEAEDPGESIDVDEAAGFGHDDRMEVMVDPILEVERFDDVERIPTEQCRLLEARVGALWMGYHTHLPPSGPQVSSDVVEAVPHEEQR